MNSFWQKLRVPFFTLAPMADVTDEAYRKLIAEMGKPDVMWTEFVSADGLYHTREIKKIPDAENPLMRELLFSDIERPIVAQIFGSNPETIRYASRLVANLGFDGVDLNMGCPDRSIEKQGAGASLIKNPTLAVKIVASAKNGVADAHSDIPVSVKTRIGYSHEIIDEWIPTILATEPDALTVHLRTRKELSIAKANWSLMPKIVALRDKFGMSTRIIGNGDIRSVAEGKEKALESGADGVMIGRGVFGNPWVFSGRIYSEIPKTERLDALVSLARAFETIMPPKHFNIFKKHIKAFVNGFNGASDLRAKLMQAESADEITDIITAYDKQSHIKTQ